MVHPARRSYARGEFVEAQVYGIDGQFLGQERFEIGESPGSGFAGQVYAARTLLQPWGAGGTNRVALKVLRPRSKFKRWFRDLLFWLSFQSSFAPRYQDEALRTGLLWQAIIREAAGIEFGDPQTVVRPLGYYWDERLRSLVEIQEWVDGGPARFSSGGEPGPQAGPCATGKAEMERKRDFMGHLARLCREMGASGISRQFEWYTLVSQPNVLTRRNPSGPASFTAVDCRPGLAVPFFLPLSPIHAQRIVHGLRQGRFVLYDEGDLPRLKAYLRSHPELRTEEIERWLRALEDDQRLYREGLPDLWHSFEAVIQDRDRRAALRRTAAARWLRREDISAETAERLERSQGLFIRLLVLRGIPLAGRFLLRLAGNAAYRGHLIGLLQRSYRQELWDALLIRDLLEWLAVEAITPCHAERLSMSFPAYLRHKLLLSWTPAWVQRLATDPAARRRLWQRRVLHPLRLLIHSGYRQSWLAEVLKEQTARGRLTPGEAETLTQQASAPQMMKFTRDVAFTAGLEIVSRLVYLLLLIYGLAADNFWPLGLAALSPIPPSGLLRFGYLLAVSLLDLPQMLGDASHRLLRARALGLAFAPWRYLGNLFAPIEIFAYSPLLSLALGEYFCGEIAQRTPVLGGRGSLLDYTLFRLAYALPLKIWRSRPG